MTNTNDADERHRPVKLEGGHLACSCGAWTSTDSGPATYPTPEEQHDDHRAAQAARRPLPQRQRHDGHDDHRDDRDEVDDVGQRRDGADQLPGDRVP